MMKNKLHNIKLFFFRERLLSGMTRSRSRAGIVALLVVGGTTTVIGCGWNAIYHSVRFNAYYTQNEREFQRLPPLSGNTDGFRLPQTDPLVDEYDYEAFEAQKDKIDALWQQAGEAQDQGEFEKTRRLLSDYLNSTLMGHSTWSSPVDCQLRRNSARDRLDAFTALNEGTRRDTLRAYLEVRRLYDDGAPKTQGIYEFGTKPSAVNVVQPSINDIQEKLDALPKDSHLDDNAQYLRAALLYRGDKFDEAALAFKALLTKYPRSEKREAALFMAALANLKQSSSFTSASALADDPCVECRDETWQAAHDLFKRSIRAFPRGQFAADARGWLAYLSLRVGDTATGIAEYYRLLANDADPNARAEGLISLRLTRAHASEDDMQQVEDDLADEPSAALAYAYHNIYNYTYSYYLAIPEKQTEGESVASDNSTSPDYGANVEEYEADAEQQKSKNTAEQRELERIVNFASSMMRTYPRAAIGGSFMLRLAEAKLELNEPRSAAEFAGRALQQSLKSADRVDALWVKGSAQYRLHQYEEARRTLAQCVATDPNGRLAEGARRLIAMIAEDANDIDGALEQYLALDYDTDVAYLVDVLMTPEQIAAFINNHPNLNHLDEMYYALGVRYMRSNRWDEARAAYAHIKTSQQSDYFHDYQYGYGCYEQDADSSNANCGNPKDPDFNDENSDGVRQQWVLRDQQTITDLENLEQVVASATGDEAKAEALYQLASYIYQGGTLLFYNPIAWNGSRYINLSFLDEYHKYRSPNESQMLWQYMQQHETPARALEIYLQVVERYPQTRAARDAFFTAAVCHERLSEYNPYWRNAYAMGLHAGQRMVTYEDVKAKYPDYKVPRGTYGWDPSTRTVNGGPALETPPKPKPRPTRREKIQHYLTLGIEWAQMFWEQKLRHWLTIGLLLCGALLVSRKAEHHRRILRYRLARRKARTVGHEDETPTWRALNETEEESTRGFRARARQLILVTLYRAGRLVQDTRLRPSLALNAISHGLLIALLITLGWTLYGGN